MCVDGRGEGGGAQVGYGVKGGACDVKAARDVADNGIGAEGGKAIGKALETNRTLTTLDLESEYGEGGGVGQGERRRCVGDECDCGCECEDGCKGGCTD